MVKTNHYGIANTYKVGDYVAVQDFGSLSMEWIVQITAFIAYGPINNLFRHYFDGVYYAAKTLANGIIDVDEWTGQPK